MRKGSERKIIALLAGLFVLILFSSFNFAVPSLPSDDDTSTDSSSKPTANVQGVNLSVPGGEVKPTANLSEGPEGSKKPMDVRWDFDSDGNWEIKYSAGLSTAQRVTHKYDKPGTYTITVEVKGPNGETDRDSYEVTIIPCSQLKNEFQGVLNKYDENGDGKITISEMMTGLDGFFANEVTFEEMCAIAAYRQCSKFSCSDHEDCDVGEVCKNGQCQESEENLPPEASVNGMTVGTIGTSINFLAKSSTDPEDKKVSKARWDFNQSDDKWDIPYSEGLNASDRVENEFWSKGEHNVTLEVMDNEGATDRAYIQVQIYGCGRLADEFNDVIAKYDEDESNDISIGELLEAVDDFLEKGEPNFDKVSALSAFGRGCSKIGCNQFCKNEGHAGATSNACGKVINIEFCSGEGTVPLGPDSGAPCDGELMGCCCKK